MDPSLKEAAGLRIAVEGCVCLPQWIVRHGPNFFDQGHGTLDAIYASVATASKARGWDGVDLLIIGGDFQVPVGNAGSRLDTDTPKGSTKCFRLDCNVMPSQISCHR
jgi:hypothetical protein